MGNEGNEYISLKTAAQYCRYSQDYLSLRARQGKLKALKFGRNWVTTREWLQEYVEKVDRKKVAKIDFVSESFNQKALVSRTPVYLFFVLLLSLVLIFALEHLRTFFQNNYSQIEDLYSRVLGANYQSASIGIQDIFQSTWEVFEEYGRWVIQILRGFVDKF